MKKISYIGLLLFVCSTILYAAVVPSLLHTTTITDTSIGLKWNSNDSAVVGYRVYSVENGQYFPIATIDDATITSYNVTAIPEGGTLLQEYSQYAFAVTAGYIVGGQLVESEYSNIAEGNTTHTWSGSLLECINEELQQPFDHVPTKVELEGIDTLNCQAKSDIVNIEPVHDLKHVKWLYLNSNNLYGSIPGWIGDLEDLIVLRLSYNYFSDSIPLEIGKLSNLQVLELQENDLSGVIPKEIGRLSNLKHLYLADNDLEGIIIKEIKNLKKLERLSLGDNMLSGSIPTWIEDLNNLVDISLSGNGLTGGIPSCIGNLSKLTSLHLSNNHLSGTIPVEITNSKSMQYLSVHDNNLSGVLPAKITAMGTLKSLNLSQNRLTGFLPSGFESLEENLTCLRLDNNRFIGSIPEGIWRLSNLEYLILSDNNLTGQISDTILNLDHLVDGWGLKLDNNCHLFSNNAEVRSFIDIKTLNSGGYQQIIDSNSNSCPRLIIPIILYILE